MDGAGALAFRLHALDERVQETAMVCDKPRGPASGNDSRAAGILTATRPAEDAHGNVGA